MNRVISWIKDVFGIGAVSESQLFHTYEAEVQAATQQFEDLYDQHKNDYLHAENTLEWQYRDFCLCPMCVEHRGRLLESTVEEDQYTLDFGEWEDGEE